MPETEITPDIAALTVKLLSAYLSNNTVAADDLAGLIRTIRAALAEDATPAQAEADTPKYTPAVPVRKSLSSPDHILSLIDGKPYKTLKRHLASNGLTPEQYRERYSLPATYPMVAPTFAARRRAIAEQIGLGSKRNQASNAVDKDLSQAASHASSPAPVISDTPAAIPVKTKLALKRKASKPHTSKAASSLNSAPIELEQEPVAGPAEALTEKPKAAKPASARKAPAKTSTAARTAITSAQNVTEVATASAAPAGPITRPKSAAKRRGKLSLFKGSDSGASSAVRPSTINTAVRSAAGEEGKEAQAKRVARATKEAVPAAKIR